MFSGLDECASRRVKGTIVLLLSFFFVFLVRFMETLLSIKTRAEGFPRLFRMSADILRHRSKTQFPNTFGVRCSGEGVEKFSKGLSLRLPSSLSIKSITSE